MIMKYFGYFLSYGLTPYVRQYLSTYDVIANLTSNYQTSLASPIEIASTQSIVATAALD
jgi:hypothetical protein